MLADIFAPDAPPVLREIPAIEVLRRVWIQNDAWEDGRLSWRSNDDIPPAILFINSRVRSRSQAQAKSVRPDGPVTSVHLTETCEEGSPHLITNVATTSAPITDEHMTETIHEELEQAHLLPG